MFTNNMLLLLLLIPYASCTIEYTCDENNDDTTIRDILKRCIVPKFIDMENPPFDKCLKDAIDRNYLPVDSNEVMLIIYRTDGYYPLICDVDNTSNGKTYTNFQFYLNYYPNACVVTPSPIPSPTPCDGEDE